MALGIFACGFRRELSLVLIRLYLPNACASLDFTLNLVTLSLQLVALLCIIYKIYYLQIMGRLSRGNVLVIG
jgi:hypothetical protein